MSTPDRALAVVLYMPEGETPTVLGHVAERWEEIISSARAIMEYARETGRGDETLSWSIVRIRNERVERIVAGAGGLEGEDLAKAISTSGVDD